MQFSPLSFDWSKETRSDKLSRDLTFQRFTFTLLMVLFLLVTAMGLL